MWSAEQQPAAPNPGYLPPGYTDYAQQQHCCSSSFAVEEPSRKKRKTLDYDDDGLQDKENASPVAGMPSTPACIREQQFASIYSPSRGIQADNMCVMQQPWFLQLPVPAPKMSDMNQTIASSSSNDSGVCFSADDSALQESALPAGNPAAVFACVPGRLQLLGNNKKLCVSVGEIKRRLGVPECLNQSILSAILRRAKNKDGGNKINADLKAHNVSLMQGRRKSAPNTVFTALCEEEALTLAADFLTVSKDSFPFKALVYEFLANMTICNPLDVEAMKQRLRNAQFVIELIGNLTSRDNSPVLTQSTPAELFMHPDSQRDFTNFSLLTHGYGMHGHQASWSVTLDAIRHLQVALENPAAFCVAYNKPAPFWTNPFL